MKCLKTYIFENKLISLFEKVKDLPDSVKGLIVFDIDDTLLKVDSSKISIYKKVDGKEIVLSTEEFAKDPDAADPNKKDLFDLRDFYTPEKVYNSIMSGTPLIRNLKIMDDYVNAGYDFCFLTARGCEETVKKALSDFLRIRKDDGALHELGDVFKKTISHAVNDHYKIYKGKTDAEKKANVLIDLCKKYDKVVFVDDDTKNVRAARGLNIKNLKVIKAWDE